jgi:beta-lactamase regulating signal transducer with metallopeptidase domain
MSTFHQMAFTQIWQVAAVTIAVALIVRIACRRRPHLAYLLWMIVIAKSLTPPFWSSPAGVFSWAAIARSPPNVFEVPAENPVPISPPSAARALPVAAAAPSLASNFEANASDSLGWLTVTNALAVVWVAGAVILAGLFAVNWVRIVGRLRRTALPLEPAWEERFRACVGELGLRRHVRFVVTSESVGPAVYGVLRPVVVLPRSVISNAANLLTPIVAHEIVHVRRGDPLAAMIQAFAQCVWWFHPCVWWANRQADRERERACDEEVLAIFGLEPAAYAQCLLEVLRMKQTLRPFVAFPGVKAIEVTKRRLEHIMQADSKFHPITPRWCWAVAIVAALIALPGAGLAFDSEPKSATGANEAKSDAAKSDAAVIKRVLDHWRSREEGTKKLHLTWECKDHPRADVWMKGKLYRVEIAGTANRDGRWWHAFDGSVTRAYDGWNRTGDISAGDLGIEQMGPALFPILLFARPFSKCGFDSSPAKWRLVSEDATLNNVQCVKLATKRKGSDETLWVDPARDDLIVGWDIRLDGGRYSTLVTIDYRRDASRGWVPTRWTEQRTSPRSAISTEETIVGCSIAEPIPNDVFAPAFPPETTVLDTRNLEGYRISNTGEKVPIAKVDSPETVKIAKALEQPVDFTIDPQPMREALDDIALRYKFTIVIHPAVAHAGVDSSMEVQLNKPGLKLKDMITSLLIQANKPLVYRVENGVLTILPAARTN